MKTKTINTVITNKINDWIKSIEDEELRRRLQSNVIVTGGCIASMLLDEKVNDYDVYFRDKETTLAVAQYYVSKFKSQRTAGIGTPISAVEIDGRIRVVVKSAGIASEEGTDTPYDYFEARPLERAGQYVSEVIDGAAEIQDLADETIIKVKEAEGLPRYRPVFITTNAITLSDDIQIVLRFYGSPEEIHDNYDYAHCTNYWENYWGKDAGKVTLRPAALEALLTRELRYVGSKYPLCSLIRMRKFLKRGWSINAGQILKMAIQIHDLDLSSTAVLSEQLVGVDAAYFSQVMSEIKSDNPDRIDAAYLVEIVDRIF